MDILKLGLTDAQILESRTINGENLITQAPKTPWWKLFFEKFNDPIIRILMIAAAVSIAVGVVEGSYYEGIGIVLAILLATGLSFFNEFKAGKEFDLLNKVGDENLVKVVRNGRFQSVAKREIVVGDVVILDTGEEVPADGTVVRAVSLEVDESKLTGESIAAKKGAEGTRDSDSENAYPYYRLLSGTNVVSGNGVMEITAVGDYTDVAKTIRAASEDVNEQTPLTKQLEHLSKVIGVGGFSFAFLTFFSLIGIAIVKGTLHLDMKQWVFVAITFVSVVLMIRAVWKPILSDLLSLIKNKPFEEVEVSWLKWSAIAVSFFVIAMALAAYTGFLHPQISSWITLNAARELLDFFMVAVTIIVVAVPEGLPMSVTLSLAYSMRKMTAANNLVRKMHACETIGAATVICTDKTGTLTMNMMRVFETKFLEDDQTLIYESATVNSTANLEDKDGERIVMGNPTEGALLLWLNSQSVNYQNIKTSFKLIEQLPFTSERKMMATFGKSSSGKTILYAKGAPEVIIEKCSHTKLAEGNRFSELKEEIHNDIIVYQKRGMRTLGFAYKLINSEEKIDFDKELNDLVWMGFAVISDPVREDVPEAIRMCYKAGIDVKVITGDNHLMATEIGRQIGSVTLENEAKYGTVVIGPDFQKLTDDELRQVLPNLKVLSRAKPLDKLRAVKMLKAMGEVVAVTGDGTNDAPALNYADVGLSMGKTGTSVAKEASDIILLDDSFTSIVNAVMWGRSLYKNIQRFIVFQLTINFAALVIAFIGPFLGVNLPFTVTQMLWVNLIMDTFAALALATEPPSVLVMDEKPRKPGSFIITKAMSNDIFLYGTAFVVTLIAMLLYMKTIEAGDEKAYFLTFFFNVFVFLQFWNLFNARVFGSAKSALTGIFANKAFVIIALMIAVMQFVVVQYGGSIMRTIPLTLTDWILSVGVTSVVLIFGEIRNRYFYK